MSGKEIECLLWDGLESTKQKVAEWVSESPLMKGDVWVDISHDRCGQPRVPLAVIRQR